MKISDLPWDKIKKIAGLVAVASGLVTTGYVAAPKTETTEVTKTQIIEITKEPIIIRPTIIIEGEKVKGK